MCCASARAVLHGLRKNTRDASASELGRQRRRMRCFGNVKRPEAPIVPEALRLAAYQTSAANLRLERSLMMMVPV
jgi:hypothetical protein